MRRHPLLGLGAALVLSGLGCDPIQLVVKEPIVERVLVMPEQSGGHATRDPRFAPIAELRDPFSAERSPAFARVLTADTDPSRIEGGTIVPGVETFPCVLPGASSAWCAKVVSGPFVVTDLQTSAGCGDHVVVAALTSRMAEVPRWSLKGALAAHGGRLALRQDELLFVAAVIGASPAPLDSSDKKARKRRTDPPPQETEPRCNVTWGGFHPYAAEEAQRSIDRNFDAPDALGPTPPLGKPRKPRILFDKLDTNAPTAPIPGSPMEPGF